MPKPNFRCSNFKISAFCELNCYNIVIFKARREQNKSKRIDQNLIRVNPVKLEHRSCNLAPYLHYWRKCYVLATNIRQLVSGIPKLIEKSLLIVIFLTPTNARSAQKPGLLTIPIQAFYILHMKKHFERDQFLSRAWQTNYFWYYGYFLDMVNFYSRYRARPTNY